MLREIDITVESFGAEALVYLVLNKELFYNMRMIAWNSDVISSSWSNFVSIMELKKIWPVCSYLSNFLSYVLLNANISYEQPCYSFNVTAKFAKSIWSSVFSANVKGLIRKNKNLKWLSLKIDHSVLLKSSCYS